MTDSSYALENPYNAPAAELQDATNTDSNSLYIVSTKKLAILFILSLGLYSIYWFYSNYKHIKKSSGEKLWPAPRAVFQLFFTYDLFKRIDAIAQSNNVAVSWSYRSLAPAYLVLLLAQNYADRISDIAGIIVLLTIPVSAYILMQVQATINTIHQNSTDDMNTRFTLRNYAWCTLGSLLWVFLILDAADILGLITLY